MLKVKGSIFIFGLYILLFIGPYLAISWDSTMGQFGILKPWGRDYLLTGTEVNVDIKGNGEVYIYENIGYLFKGTYREVYREPNIMRSPGPYPYIDSVNASCDPKCTVIDRQYEIAGSFGSIRDRSANFMLYYNVLNGIVQGSDISEFQYKVWGDQWDKPVGGLHGTITLPAEPVAVYFNPAGIADYHVQGNTITYSTGTFNNYLEARVLMPKDAVSGNFLQDSSLTLSGVKQQQTGYAVSYYLLYSVAVITAIAILLSMFIVPVMVYSRHGREPDIGYNAVYEREPVKGIKPYIVNSLVMGKTGDTDKNAITATLLDLIRRKHITLKETVSKKGLFKKKKKDLTLVFEKNANDIMSAAEQKVYDFFSRQGTLVWSDFLDSLKKRDNAVRFMAFTKDFEHAVDNDYQFSEYFENAGSRLWRRFCIGLILVSAALILLGQLSHNYPFLGIFQVVYAMGLGYGVIGLFIPIKVFGRFTPKGYEVYLKSLKYRKFMTDMTLLKKYPPASIVIWEEVLVYATLFGVADKVIKQLKLVFPDTKASSSGLYPLYSATALHSFSSHYSVATSTMSASSGGHGGGVGGGFGGGGGGAR